MQDYGEFSNSTYRREFGGWRQALQEAGIDPDPKQFDTIPEAALIEELQRLADELGRSPRGQDVNEHGKFSFTTHRRPYETWDDALEAAGLSTYNQAISRGELIEELRRLADELERPSTQDDIIEYSEYSPRPFYRGFDGLVDARQAAGVDKIERE